MAGGRTEAEVEQGAGLQTHQVHGEGLECLAVVVVHVDLTGIIVVSEDQVICIKNLLQAPECADSGLNGNALFVGADGLNLAQMLLQFVEVNDLVALTGSTVHNDLGTDIVSTGASLDFFLDGFDHLNVGQAAEHEEAVLTGHDVDAVTGLDPGHVNVLQGFSGRVRRGLQIVAAVRVDCLRHSGEQVADLDRNHVGMLICVHLRLVAVNGNAEIVNLSCRINFYVAHFFSLLSFIILRYISLPFSTSAGFH